MHVPDSFSIFGMVAGVIMFPVIILGSLFLIVKAIVGL
jgi:hypothetical protein